MKMELSVSIYAHLLDSELVSVSKVYVPLCGSVSIAVCLPKFVSIALHNLGGWGLIIAKLKLKRSKKSRGYGMVWYCMVYSAEN